VNQQFICARLQIDLPQHPNADKLLRMNPPRIMEIDYLSCAVLLQVASSEAQFIADISGSGMHLQATKLVMVPLGHLQPII
jgi:hypothetical protein